jgi:outer membrane receptor protein involved in Fe transport
LVLQPIKQANFSMRYSSLPTLLISNLIASSAMAGGLQTSERVMVPVVVEASRTEQIGVADSANQGVITRKQLENRPLSRTAELLEVVPGVIVTQHSGDGKANQYYVRGFNLDHGTDLRTTVLGMPVNMPTHAHGQGYSDLNFLIPELIDTIRYKKGTYYAEEGDFSAAGAAAFDYVRALDKGIASIELGQHQYRRAVVADSTALGPGTLLYAVEAAAQNGPWILPEHYRRYNGVLSYSWKTGADSLRVTGMALQSAWTATDQIPRRAIDSGQIDRFGHVDPTDGGDTARYSLSGDWQRRTGDGAITANAYLIRSHLDLFSNFTYALNDPVNGDQFQQSERRTVAGANIDRTWFHTLGSFDSETTAGFQLRNDRISPVGLYATIARRQLSTTREDDVTQNSTALFASNTTRWTPWFRSIAGVRADHYRFDVTGRNPADSGKVNDTIVSPKLSTVFSPGEHAEIYLNWGRGFHSNDARGVTQRVDPATPLVKATGKEAGLRLTGLVEGLQTSLSLWRLDLASELVFVGDAGTTEAGRPSRRTGLEIANYYIPAPGWIIDADLAWSRARFTDADPTGNRIPGAIERTASIGLSAEHGKWSGGLRLRYFGDRPLIEDNSVRSGSSTIINAKLGYAFSKTVKLTAEILNLADRKVSDVDYYYQSRLSNEAAPSFDIHTHPAEPRTVRIGMVINF